MQAKKQGGLSTPLSFMMEQQRHWKLVGERISALPLKSALNTVQFANLPKPQDSYDCTPSL